MATEQGLRWTVDTPDAALPAALGTCLLAWLLNHDQTRLGTCHAANCVEDPPQPFARRQAGQIPSMMMPS